MDEVMKIWYAVAIHPYEYVEIIGVFSSRELAESAVEQHKLELHLESNLDYAIQESTLDAITNLWWC